VCVCVCVILVSLSAWWNLNESLPTNYLRSQGYKVQKLIEGDWVAGMYYALSSAQPLVL